MSFQLRRARLGWLALVFTSGGCRSFAPVDAPALVFARSAGEEVTYHEQAINVPQPNPGLALEKNARDLRVAPSARVAVSLVARVDGGGELRAYPWPLNGTSSHRLAAEWAWDFAVNRRDGAVAWTAGAQTRQVFVARPPSWTSSVLVLPPDMTPAGPVWIGSDLAIVLRGGGRTELVVWKEGRGIFTVRHTAPPGSGLEIAAALPGQSALLVVEASSDPRPGCLLRVPLAGGAPTELARGFFLPSAAAVSPDEKFIGIVWSERLNDVLGRTAPLRWLGATPPGLPAEIPSVTSATWSEDGQHLAVAISRNLQRGIYVYSTGPESKVPRQLGFLDALCSAPQWVTP